MSMSIWWWVNDNPFWVILTFMSTTLQSQASLWYEHRKGRLTASQVGVICKTSVEDPSKSLIESNYAKKDHAKSSSSTVGNRSWKWSKGRVCDKDERDSLIFEIEFAWLLVNPLSPHLGVSPDGLVSCSYCGLRVLEIKCPFSVRHTVPTRAA